ncbi:MAG: hypothetical protein N2249_00060 [Melioribacter sp.]|nr:hypothetical protein [Melioribacter sp.]
MKKIIFACVLLILFNTCSDNSNVTSPEQLKYSLKEQDSIVVVLKYHQSILVNDDLKIYFDDVIADSRCPINAQCVWAGDGEIKLNFAKDEVKFSTTLHTTLIPKSIVVWNYFVGLNSLLPYPELGKEIREEEYKAELKIKLK